MATTIQSGRGSSPLLTADVASTAEVYGGRGLVFDGVSDYLDCGDITSLNSTSAFTISVWIKSDNTNSLDYLYNKTSSSSSLIRMAIAYNIMYFNVYNGGNAYGSVAFTSTDWNHISLVFNGSGTGNSNRLKAYINGEEQSLTYTGTIPSTTANLSGATFQIGKYLTDHFEGKMSDVKVYSSALTEAEVQSQYLKPESVPSPSSLVAWYPMSEANPESPQSIVYDHSEKKLGSENITNGDFSSASSWTDDSGVSINTTTGKAIFTNAPSVSLYQGIGSSLTGFYKISFDITDYTSGTLQVYGGAEYSYGDAGLSSFTSTGSHVQYVELTSSFNGNIIFGGDSSFNGSINNVSVKEVLIGNHATTNFFSTIDEVEDGAFATATNASTTGAYWTTQSAWDINTTSSGKAYVNNTGGGNNSITQSSSNGSVSANPLTAGKTYRTTGTAVVSSLDAGTYLNVMSGGSTTKTIVPAGSSGTVNFDEEFVADTGTLQYRMVGVGSLTLNNVTCKEVGVSSTGFATAQNEPVIPQIPLVKYNEKMAVPSDASTNTYVHLPDGLTAGLTEITISMWFQKIKSGNSFVTLFAVDGGGTYFRDTSNNRITCHMPFDNGGNPFTNFEFPNDLALHHYVFTVKSGNQEVYRDGVLVHSTTVTTTTMSHNIRRIGNYANSQDNSMADEVAFFNKHFTQAEAQELFNDGLACDATTHSKSGNLLGYWRNDGVTTWQDRRGWSYLDFDGNDYVSSSSAITAFGTNPFSVSVWVNPDATGQSALFSNSNGASGDYFFLSIDATNFVGTGTSSQWKHQYSDSVITLGNWHLVTYVREGTGTNQSKWYLDGALVNTSTDATNWLSGSGWHMGSYDNSNGKINAQISQFAIFNNKALSAPEVLEQYTNGIATNFTTSGMTHHWVLNDGTTITDLIAGNNGAVTGATLNTGNDGDVQGTPDSITIREGLNSGKDGLGFPLTNPSGNVLRLNGGSEYVEIPDNKVLSFGDSAGDLPFTISAWIKPRGASALFRILDKSTSTSVVEYNLSIDSSSKCTLALYDGSTSNVIYRPSSSSIVADQWTFVTATYNGSGSNNGINIYINDALNNGTASSSGSYTAMHNTTSALKIGIRKFDDSFGNGLIDELRVYNKELSLAEIQKNYKHQKGKHKND